MNQKMDGLELIGKVMLKKPKVEIRHKIKPLVFIVGMVEQHLIKKKENDYDTNGFSKMVKL